MFFWAKSRSGGHHEKRGNGYHSLGGGVAVVGSRGDRKGGPREGLAAWEGPYGRAPSSRRSSQARASGPGRRSARGPTCAPSPGTCLLSWRRRGSPPGWCDRWRPHSRRGRRRPRSPPALPASQRRRGVMSVGREELGGDPLRRPGTRAGQAERGGAPRAPSALFRARPPSPHGALAAMGPAAAEWHRQRPTRRRFAREIECCAARDVHRMEVG